MWLFLFFFALRFSGGGSGFPQLDDILGFSIEERFVSRMMKYAEPTTSRDQCRFQTLEIPSAAYLFVRATQRWNLSACDCTIHSSRPLAGYRPLRRARQ